MDNTNILSMGSLHGKYKAYWLIALCIAISAFAFGIPMLYAAIKYEYTDELSVWLVGLYFCLIGAHASLNALGNHIRCKKSSKTNLIVSSNEIRGTTSLNEFAVNVDEVVSTAVNVCSVTCDSYGTPLNMNPGLGAKLSATTTKYLCIYTNSGKNIFIDCLTSPEVAKTTIDSLIIRNMANKG